MQIVARRYDTLEPVRITTTGDVITLVESLPDDGSTRDLPYVAPGLFDLQINGYGGTWFSDDGLRPQQVLDVLVAHFPHGITRMCPTLITAPFEALHAGFSAIRQACDEHAWADRMVAGCHLEGPYLSGEDGPRGAHPKDQIRPADWDEFAKLQEASGGRIRLVTIAPEVEGAVDFIRQARQNEITIAIGHTAANTEQIAAAVDAGASLSTHLGNGAHGVLRRHPNYIWDQLGEPRLAASIITDGYHLPASVVRSIYGVKGAEGTIITCDASGLAGAEPGEYDVHGVRVEVLLDGPIVVAGQRQMLAGAGVQTDVCVATAMNMIGCSFKDAFNMAGSNVSSLLGCELIELKESCRADLIVFDWEPGEATLRLRQTIAGGEVRYSANES